MSGSDFGEESAKESGRCRVLKSKEDASVNFIFPAAQGFEEARYVRRTDDYFVCYLSAQTACKMGCKMCHLTATGQTVGEDVSVERLLEQADVVLEYYDTQPKAKTVHFSFMARGEPLDSNVLRTEAYDLFTRLGNRAIARGLLPKFCISTIMPRKLLTSYLGADDELADLFPVIQPDLYYSIYSMDPAFRKQWLPSAMDPFDALTLLATWQHATHKIPKIHHAFIKGQNDSFRDVEEICDEINQFKLRVNWNVVRYNPVPGSGTEEPAEPHILSLAQRIRECLPEANVRVVSRVGFDAKASCGMFVGGDQ